MRARKSTMLAIALLACCTSKNPVVGKWENGVDRITFAEDGTGIIENVRGGPAREISWSLLPENRFKLTKTGEGVTFIGCHAPKMLRITWHSGSAVRYYRGRYEGKPPSPKTFDEILDFSCNLDG